MPGSGLGTSPSCAPCSSRRPEPLRGRDLNVRPGHPSHAALASPFTDVWRSPATAQAPTFPSHAPTARIDYLFVGPAVRALRAWTAGGAVSDHLMVVADVRLS